MSYYVLMHISSPPHYNTPCLFLLSCCLHLCCLTQNWITLKHYDVMMGEMASQITSLTIVYSTVYSDADQRKHQSSASLAFVQGILRGPVNFPHKWPVTRKMFPCYDVIMWWSQSNKRSRSFDTGITHSQHNAFARVLSWYFVTCLWNEYIITHLLLIDCANYEKKFNRFTKYKIILLRII